MSSHKWIDLLQRPSQLNFRLDIPGRESCKRFTPIADEIWCPIWDTGEIHIVNLNSGAIERTIDASRQIKKPSCVTDLNGNSVAIAAANGMFIMDKISGDITQQLCYDFVSDTSLYNDVLLALQHVKYKDTCELLYFKQVPEQHSWKEEKRVELRYRTPGLNDTMIVANAIIFICSWSNGCVYQFNMSGNFIAVNGERGHGRDGQLWQPVICSIDSQFCLLILEKEKQRFQILDTNQGSWRLLSQEETFLRGRGGESLPVTYALFTQDGAVLMLGENGRTLFKITVSNDS